jgi:SagB-type dehydrogenase family enzyme
MEVILKRRTIRNYSNQPLDLNQVSYLLYLSYGITSKNARENYVECFRASPSAGATYPLELYPFVFNVEGLKRGIYHYNVRDNVLEFLKEGDFRTKLSDIALGQDFVAKSAVTFVLTAIFDRTIFKYGERGYRYVLLDAGHLVQNIYLVSTALGLGACSIGGFFDDELNALLEIDGVNESAIYAISVGKINVEKENS